jgi:hypothetical protein
MCWRGAEHSSFGYLPQSKKPGDYRWLSSRAALLFGSFTFMPRQAASMRTSTLSGIPPARVRFWVWLPILSGWMVRAS